MVMFMPRTSNGFTPEYNNDYFTVSSEYNTEYDFFIARVNTLIGLIHQAEQELSSKDQASKDQASEDQASKDQASKDQASKDQASKDQASEDQARADQASPTSAASIDPPCSSKDKLNRLQEDAYQILRQYPLKFFESKKYPDTLIKTQKDSLIMKRKALDRAISKEFSPHRSEVSIGKGGLGAAYILLHPHYEENIESIIEDLNDVDKTDSSVHHLTQKLQEIKSNLKNIRELKYSQGLAESGSCSANKKAAEEERRRKLEKKATERNLASMADKHLELIREWKTCFKEYLKKLDDNYGLDVDERKRLQARKIQLHRRNAPIVRSDPDNPASSLLSVRKLNISKKETGGSINSELSIYKGVSLNKQRALGNEQGQASDTHSRPRYCLYKSMANAAMDVANFHAKYCRPHQDIKLANQADDGLFDEMSRDSTIRTLDGSLEYMHPYMVKLYQLKHKRVSADLPQNRLSTVVDARALGLSFIGKILPDFLCRIMWGSFYNRKNTYNDYNIKSKEYLLQLFRPVTEDWKDFLDTNKIVRETQDKLSELYTNNNKLKVCDVDLPDVLARIVSVFISRMITVDLPNSSADPEFCNIPLAMQQYCHNVPTDIEQVQFFSLLHRLMDLTQSHGSVQSKINRDIKEIITRLDSLAKPSKYVYLAKSDGSVVMSQVKPNGYSEKDIVTIEDSDIDDIYNGNTLLQLNKKNKQFLDIQKEIKTVDTSNASEDEKSDTALRGLFAKQRDLIAADKLDRPSYQYAIINQGKRDALKTLFKRSIAQGHPAPEVQLFVDPHLRDELTRYQNSIEKYKDCIDRGSTLDDLYKRDEGSRPPAAMRERLQEYYFETFFGKISYDRPHKTKLLPKHVQKYCAAVRLMHILTNPCEEQSRRINMVCTIYPLATYRFINSGFKNLYEAVKRYVINANLNSSNSELLNARLVEYTSKLERENKSVKMYIRKTLSPQPSSGSSFFGGTKRSNKYQVVDSATSSCATPPQVHS